MKTSKFCAGLLLFISFTFSNCSPDYDFASTTNEIITRGSWGVDFFVNQDKTVEYGNYIFHFAGNGTLQGTDGNNTTEGKWKVIHDVDRTDVLMISMNEQNKIQELNNAWSVKTKSNEVLGFIAKETSSEFRIKKLN